MNPVFDLTATYPTNTTTTAQAIAALLSVSDNLANSAAHLAQLAGHQAVVARHIAEVAAAGVAADAAAVRGGAFTALRVATAPPALAGAPASPAALVPVLDQGTRITPGPGAQLARMVGWCPSCEQMVDGPAGTCPVCGHALRTA